MLLGYLLLQFSLINSLATYEVCTKNLKITGPVLDYCSLHSLTLIGNCCFNKTQEGCSTVAINMNSFNNSQLSNEVFRNQSCLPLPFIRLMDLSEYYGNISEKAFKGFTGLNDIFIPIENERCPGRRNGAAWLYNKTTESSGLHCYTLASSCEADNFTCAENSICTENGPGLYNCSCLPGRYGYKCLRKGQFPYATFFSILVSVTLVLSTFLWFTQRRHIKKPIKIVPM